MTRQCEALDARRKWLFFTKYEPCTKVATTYIVLDELPCYVCELHRLVWEKAKKDGEVDKV